MKKLILLLLALSFLVSCAGEKIDCEENENEESCKFMEDWNKSGTERFKQKLYKKIDKAKDEKSE